MAEISSKRYPGAYQALALLLFINLFNYIDRYILAAVEPHIRAAFFAPDAAVKAYTGSLNTAFLVTYMCAAPLFGWLADRYSRWKLIGFSVILWSLASAGSGFASVFIILFITRLFVGIGEAGYGPAAPSLISDLFPIQNRGLMLSFFYLAIPVGSAIGFAFGGKIGDIWGWRWPFYLVALPGILIGILCFFMPDPPRGGSDGTLPKKIAILDGLKLLCKNRSYVFNTLAMTAMTFAIGGMSFWIPAYVHEFRGQPDLGKVNLIFGIITVVAGLSSTLLGGLIGDFMRRFTQGAYFLVSGIGILIAFPLTIVFLYTPFPSAWIVLFFAVFFLFFNTGPSNTALANCTRPEIRSTAFAINIFVIHALGDAISPPLIGAIADRYDMNKGFMVVSLMMLAGGVLWLLGMRYLGRDTEAALARDTVLDDPGA